MDAARRAPAVCIANEKLFVAELGNHRLQILTLDGLPLQCVPACGPVSGVCADDEHACVTSVEGDHAITLWRTATPPVSLTPRRDSIASTASRRDSFASCRD